MQIKISLQDEVLKRFGNQLAALGNGQAKVAMSRALNHEGDKGRTQVKRVLAKQTGINYGKINKAVRTINSTPATLVYTIEARGDETNLGLFGARQGKKGVSAAPWGKRRVFPHTFLVHGKVYAREGKARLPIKGLFGPNIAREIVKDESAEAFRTGSANIADRVGHEVARMLDGA